MPSIEEIERALTKGSAEKRKFEDISYIRFRSSYKKIERGSVVIDTDFFPGFPHIKRIFTLEKGLEKNIKTDFVFAEEKIDGYNLRAVKIKDKIYALSRGGIIDGFSTEKLQEHIPKKIFEKKIMLCGEMIGNTPYTHPTNEFDIKYFVFDIYNLKENKYFAPNEKYLFLRKNKLESIPYLGKFNKKKDIKKIKRLVLDLNKSKKEGIVFKSENRESLVKYVNPNADIEDIGNTIELIFDMPIGYYNQRLLRSGIFIKEYGLDFEEYGNKLGKAIYSRFIEGLKMLEKQGEIYHEYEILIKNRKIWDELSSHMSKEIRLEKIFEKQENEGYRIRFRKIYIKTTKKLKSFLNGKGMSD